MYSHLSQTLSIISYTMYNRNLLLNFLTNFWMSPFMILKDLLLNRSKINNTKLFHSWLTNFHLRRLRKITWTLLALSRIWLKPRSSIVSFARRKILQKYSNMHLQQKIQTKVVRLVPSQFWIVLFNSTMKSIRITRIERMENKLTMKMTTLSFKTRRKKMKTRKFLWLNTLRLMWNSYQSS